MCLCWPSTRKDRATLTLFVDPDYSPPELRHGPRVPHVRLGIGPTTFVKCRIVEHALPPTTRYKPNSDPQLISLVGWRGE